MTETQEKLVFKRAPYVRSVSAARYERERLDAEASGVLS
jgi:hypothetical protein